MITFLKFINNLDYKPKLLLHSCCAPCSSHTILLLKQYFDLTIYYSNDNIYPKDEFDTRLKEQISFALMHNINVIHDYNENDFNKAISGYEHMGEKSIRCYKCYELRLDKTASKAKELGFEYFTTTLSISPYKNSDWINEIGYELVKNDIKAVYDANGRLVKADMDKKSISKAGAEFFAENILGDGCTYKLMVTDSSLNPYVDAIASPVEEEPAA